MAENKEKMTQSQKIVLERKGFLPSQYEILYDLPHTMIVRNISTKEPAVIFKD